MENLHGPEGGVPHTGTTIVACVYPGGVVIGADGRVSVGNYISNRASNKITPLTDNVYLLRSGSAPDTQAVADYGMIRGFLHIITSHLLRLLPPAINRSVIAAL
jgi:20S proteasome alpha/beta subunit